MNKETKSTEVKKRQESQTTTQLREALRFAGHSLGCNGDSCCECGYEELCLGLARTQREDSPPPEKILYLLKEYAPEITGHTGDQCQERRCRCGAKKALRRLSIGNPDPDQFVAWWCNECSKEYSLDELKFFWKSKDDLTVPLDSTIAALKESNRKKCAIGNCPTEDCSGVIRKSILSLKRTIPDVPF